MKKKSITNLLLLISIFLLSTLPSFAIELPSGENGGIDWALIANFGILFLALGIIVVIVLIAQRYEKRRNAREKQESKDEQTKDN